MDDDGGAACRPFPFSEQPDELPDVDALRSKMIRDGYFNIPALPWAVDVESLGLAAKLVLDEGLPASFLLAYKEPWLIAHQVSEIASFHVICASVYARENSARSCHADSTDRAPPGQVKELLWMATGNEQIFDWYWGSENYNHIFGFIGRLIVD